jgi:hypothetical protein
MKPEDRQKVILEQIRLQEDLDAFLNVPPGVELKWKWYQSVRWLENRIGALSSKLVQRKES